MFRGLLLLTLFSALCACQPPAAATGPALRADYVQRDFVAEAFYTTGRYARLYYIDPLTAEQRELRCKCRDSCSRADKWLEPRTVTLSVLERQQPPTTERPLVLSMTEIATGQTINYTYERCLK